MDGLSKKLNELECSCSSDFISVETSNDDDDDNTREK
jgi:hypothetical protein